MAFDRKDGLRSCGCRPVGRHRAACGMTDSVYKLEALLARRRLCLRCGQPAAPNNKLCQKHYAGR